MDRKSVETAGNLKGFLKNGDHRFSGGVGGLDFAIDPFGSERALAEQTYEDVASFDVFLQLLWKLAYGIALFCINEDIAAVQALEFILEQQCPSRTRCAVIADKDERSHVFGTDGSGKCQAERFCKIRRGREPFLRIVGHTAHDDPGYGLWHCGSLVLSRHLVGWHGTPQEIALTYVWVLLPLIRTR